MLLMLVIGYNATGVSDNAVQLGNASTTIWHPADDNGVDLGSTSYSFKDAYIQGSLKIGDTSGSTYFQFPTTTGSAGQVLQVPTSGNVLVWSTGVGISFAEANNSLVVGHSTLPASGSSDNTALGFQALDALTTGNQNTAVGSSAATAITEAESNVAIGYQALQSATTSGQNVAIGDNALSSEDTATNPSIAIGFRALLSQNGTGDNVGIGESAGASISSGANNVLVGNSAGGSLVGASKNTAIGHSALAAETTGTSTAVGYNALLVSNGGTSNAAFGSTAGNNVSTGDFNTLIGESAGGTIATGSSNVCIGRRADTSTSSASNAIAIGSAALAAANQTVIGTTSTLDARIFGLRTNVTATTADTTLTANDSGETFVFNDTAATFTLPDSGAGDLTGVYFHFIVLNDSAGTKRIQCADSTNEDLIGAVLTVDTDSSDANASFAAQVSDEFHQITFDGTTTGRAGSKVTVTNIAADKWHVEGTLLCTGSPATPFS